MRSYIASRPFRWSVHLACFSAATLLSACDESFTPIVPTDLNLSIYGYLDASADTQWIRIMPIRPLLVTSQESFDATVTLEHLGTGQMIQMRDSLFRFSNHLHPELGSDGVYLHNFWTTERIEPGASYRFTARLDGEEPSEAIVEIPDDYDVEVTITQVSFGSDFLRLEGLKQLPFVTVTSYFYDPCGEGTQSVSFESQRPDGDLHWTPIARMEVPPRAGCGSPTVDRREIRAAGSAVAWPSGTAYSPSGLAVPEGISNISNAVGFIGGVLTRVVPYENCEYQGGASGAQNCVLRYDASSALLRGTVREVRCGDGALDSATVTLTEIDPQPPSMRKVRTATTGRSGEFEIAALEPATRYALEVRPKPVPDPFWGLIDIHSIPTDTITFTPGQDLLYDVEVVRYTICE